VGHYSSSESSVRVDFWKPSGKWYATEAVEYDAGQDEPREHSVYLLCDCPDCSVWADDRSPEDER
jgi:hypothetical protein